MIKLVVGLVFFSSLSSFAAIKHKNCEVYSNARLLAPSVGFDEAYDWSQRGNVDSLFLNNGLISQGYRDIEDIEDGALFTDLVTTYGGERSWVNTIYSSYTILLLYQRDLQVLGGKKIVAKSASNKQEPYSTVLDQAVQTSLQQAITRLPLCVKID